MSPNRIAWVAACLGGVTLAQQIAAKTARDALFLATEGANALPRIMVVSAAVSLLFVVLVARLIGRFGPFVVLVGALAVNGALFGAEALLAGEVTWIPSALYLHMAALGGVLVSTFWSVVSERLDPGSARALMGRIGGGATLGGALGGILADGGNRLLGPSGLLALLAVSCLVAMGLALPLAARSTPSVAQRAPTPSADARTSSALALLRDTPYLGALAALSMLGAVWQGLLDFGMKSELASHLEGPGGLVSFFGWFYTAIGVATFLVQASLGGPLLKKFGIDKVVAITPVVVAALGILTGALSTFWMVVALRGVETLLANSVHRSSYELFFTPIPKAVKRPTKALVDVAATRVGDALAGALMFVWVALAPMGSARGPVLLAALTAIVGFLLLSRLHRGYVEALTKALQSGNVLVDEGGELDALTQRTIAESQVSVDREALLREIEEYRREQEAARGGRRKVPEPRPSAPASTARPSAELKGATIDPRAALAMLLSSSDLERVVVNLDRGVEPALVPFVVPLLARPETRTAATGALARLGPRIVGALSDVLLDETEARSVRVAVAELLSTSTDARARAALIMALSVESQPLELAVARALVTQSRLAGGVPLSPEQVFKLVAESVDRAAARGALLTSLPEGDSLTRVDARLWVAVTLLGVVLEPEPLALVVAALGGSDRVLRGTAIELLENVVDEPARGKLLEVLRREPSRARRRSEQDLLSELLRSKS
jgi:ATP:ADP antiporter, AAA family